MSISKGKKPACKGCDSNCMASLKGQNNRMVRLAVDGVWERRGCLTR